jgi:ribulose-phosphate 3-epimerase
MTATAAPRPIEIAPSVLPCDFAKLGEECVALEKAGVDRIQFDVIASVRPHLTVPFEAHLMVEEPDRLAHLYVEAGCERLIVHAEACLHLHRVLGAITDLGATAAVALNPATPASAIEHVLDLVDLVLVMTVNPGFGGQSYIATMEPKIAEIRGMITARNLDVDLEVDGGISTTTVGGAASAGANVLVAGSALFRDPEGLTHAVSDLRERAEASRLAP